MVEVRQERARATWTRRREEREGSNSRSTFLGTEWWWHNIFQHSLPQSHLSPSCHSVSPSTPPTPTTPPSRRNPLTPFRSEALQYFSEHTEPFAPALRFSLIACVVNHLLSEEESRPSLPTHPQWTQDHSSLKSRPSTCHLPSSFHPCSSLIPLFLSSLQHHL